MLRARLTRASCTIRTAAIGRRRAGGASASASLAACHIDWAEGVASQAPGAAMAGSGLPGPVFQARKVFGHALAIGADITQPNARGGSHIYN